MNTPEAVAAYINSQVMMCRIELEGMLAKNTHRLSLGQTIAYDEEAFQTLYNNYEPTLGYNAVVELFSRCSR